MILDDALHATAQRGDLDGVQRLLAKGHDINAVDDLGKTALHYAVGNEHFEVAQLLLRAGADVDARDEASVGNTPLGEVAGSCSLRIARLLVDSGADPTIRGWMQLNALDRARSRKRGDGPQVYDLLLTISRSRSSR